MLFDQPHLYEIEDMICFARKYKPLYIYGCASNQEYLLKFFDICGINIDGYITTFSDDRELCYRKIPKYTLDTVNLKNAGIIIGLSDKYFDGVVPKLRERGFTDYFLMSEHNKRAIAHKLTPRPRERMWIEISLADHCNLNCKMCDHFSHLAPPVLLDIDEFRHDMERLAKLSDNHIGSIKLEGGEPLLHRGVNKFIEITRELFPKCSIEFFTNGLLLMKAEHYDEGNFWQCCIDNKMNILMTRYPINLNVEQIKAKAGEYGASLQIFGEASTRHSMGLYSLSPSTIDKKSTKHPFNLSGNIEKYCFISCYHFNECITLSRGRLYTCPIIPHVHYFNEAFGQHLEMSDENSIDIHKANSYEEIAEFVARRVPFCNYCDIKNRRTMKWARSNRKIEEYVDYE